MRIERLGDGLALRLPPEAVKALRLDENTEVRLEVAPGGMLVIVVPDPAREAALATLRQLAVTAPPDFRFSREEVNERG